MRQLRRGPRVNPQRKKDKMEGKDPTTESERDGTGKGREGEVGKERDHCEK